MSADVATHACRYDVKYGSAGFNTFGYQAGCEFATGAFQEAMAVPAAARYLCEELDKEGCTHDLSTHGTCIGFEAWDDFNRVEPVCAPRSAQPCEIQGNRWEES